MMLLHHVYISGLYNLWGLLSCSWLEDTLLKLLHLLRTYVRRMRQTEVKRTRKRDKNFSLLDDLEKRFKCLMKELTSLVKSKVTECSKLMYEYMVSDNARHQVTLWKYGDIPESQVLDDWVILEYGLDEAIDDRYVGRNHSALCS